MAAPSATAAAAAETTSPPSSTATGTPSDSRTNTTTVDATTTTTTTSADNGATPLPPFLPSEAAVDTAAAASRPTLRSAIASGRSGLEAASAFVSAHASMPAAALARIDARVDGVLASFTRALRRTRDGTTSGMVAAGGVFGSGALVAAPLAYVAGPGAAARAFGLTVALGSVLVYPDVVARTAGKAATARAESTPAPPIVPARSPSSSSG
ncbi:hypothetical protein MMPV_007405 [Pyropia vietnamensis]